MPNTFQTDLSADLANTFFSASEFGERISYLPASAAPRTISAFVVHTGQRFRDELRDELHDNLSITLSNTAAAGVANPAVGDRVLRSGETEPYHFQQILSSDPVSFKLLFQRRRPREVR